AQVPQAQLARYFGGGFQVAGQGVLLLVIAGAFIAAVYVYYVQGFRSFYDQVYAAIQVHGFAKRGLYLAGNAVMVKNGRAVMIVGNNILLLRRYLLDVGAGIGIDAFIINDDAVKALVQQIAENAGGFGLLAQYFLRG